MGKKAPPNRWILFAAVSAALACPWSMGLAYEWLRSNGHPPATITGVLVGSFAAAVAAAMLVWLLARRRFPMAYAPLSALLVTAITWLVIAVAHGQHWHDSSGVVVFAMFPTLALIPMIVRSQVSRPPDGEVPRPMAKSWSRRG